MEQPQKPEDAGGGSILLTYFTRADNTVVEEPFSGGCGQCLDRASDEKAENARPGTAPRRCLPCRHPDMPRTGYSGVS